MSMVTYPLNNIEYTAEDAELFHLTRTSGVYANNSFDYSVSGADNTITIGSGVAWIKNSEFSGKVVAQKDPISLDLGVSDSNYPRIDAVVIQFDSNKNSTNIIVKNGTAVTNPAPPSITRTESVYELHLYHIYRSSGSISISASDITDLRLNSSYCGIMADSVTHVDTDAIEAQISELIKRLKAEIASVVDGSAYWLKTDVIPIKNGGTNAKTATEALLNLGAAPLINIGVFTGNLNDAPVNTVCEITGATTSTPISSTGICETWGSDNNNKLQRITYFGYSQAYRVCNDGARAEWRWETVPLEPNKEYLTTERWNTLPVYVKRVDMGRLAAPGGVVTVHTGVYGDTVRYIDVKGIAINGTTSLAMVNAGGNGNVLIENSHAKWSSVADLSPYTGYVIIKYVK